jgi:hypothetical protein
VTRCDYIYWLEIARKKKKKKQTLSRIYLYFRWRVASCQFARLRSTSSLEIPAGSGICENALLPLRVSSAVSSILNPRIFPFSMMVVLPIFTFAWGVVDEGRRTVDAGRRRWLPHWIALRQRSLQNSCRGLGLHQTSEGTRLHKVQCTIVVGVWYKTLLTLPIRGSNFG